jgi:hypothetical protein
MTRDGGDFSIPAILAIPAQLWQSNSCLQCSDQIRDPLDAVVDTPPL